MKTPRTRRSWARYGVMLAGVAILAFGMYNIHSRTDITEGGILGMQLLLHHWLRISPSVSGLVLNALCYALGFRLLGREFLKGAVVASIGYSVFYKGLELAGVYLLPDLSAQPLLAAVLGAAFVGVGCGLVVREGAAAGGDDALALILSKLLRCRISRAYLATDLTVLALSLSYIPFRRILWSLVTVTLSSLLVDVVQRASFCPRKRTDELT